MRTAIAVIGCCILLLGALSPVFAQPRPSFLDDEELAVNEGPATVVNRPPNVQGLTGLIMTNSAYTQPKGHIVAGLASIAQNSNDPNFSILQGIATVTAGVTDSVEIGLRAQLVGTNLGSSKNREFGFGDTDLLAKWRITSQGETMPAIALGLGYTVPTGDKEQGIRTVEDQAIRVMLIGTTEHEMPGDYFIGIYFEGQIVYADRMPWEKTGKGDGERYGAVNAGLLLPLNDARSLQAMLEYNTVVKKDITSAYAPNYFGIMPGLRYVTPEWNVSLGIQFYNPTDPDMTDNLRYLGTLSYAF